MAESKDSRHADHAVQPGRQYQRNRERRADGGADHRHRLGAVLIARQVRRHGHHRGRYRAGTLQHAPKDHHVDVHAERRDEAARREYREPGVNHRLAAVAIRPPAERDLEHRLRETVDSDSDADQREVVPARQSFRVDREHRQDHEHAEHAQPENRRQAERRAQLHRAHAAAVAHGRSNREWNGEVEQVGKKQKS
jgi:hypothetical protein